jgi:hypothetical protein
LGEKGEHYRPRTGWHEANRRREREKTTNYGGMLLFGANKPVFVRDTAQQTRDNVGAVLARDKSDAI